MAARVSTGNESPNYNGISVRLSMDLREERCPQRQKINMHSILCETARMKEDRRSTFSHWPHSQILPSRTIEAGFFGCNKGDRVICLYCGLICHHWNNELDDPCEVHQRLAPHCSFVKSMSCCHSLEYNQIVSTLPSHNDYVKPDKRLESFSSWFRPEFPPIDKLVEAGFFYAGCKIVCFYCNGSFDSWELNRNPIAEHVRQFPDCNYARQLCGEGLYYRIQLAKHVQEGIGIRKFRNTHLPSYLTNEDSFNKYVAGCIDLPISRYSSIEQFDRTIVKQCWIDQLRIKHDIFGNTSELSMACRILQKQKENSGDEDRNIIVPSVALRDVYERRSVLLPNNSNQSYSDILASFDNDHQTYRNARQASCQQFTEDEETIIKREITLHRRSDIKRPPRDMAEGGWMVYGGEDYTTQCPHCYVQYSKWKPDDDPLLIHRHLSPLCPFVLSTNPLNSKSIPVRKVEEHFTDEAINTAVSQPYTGLVRSGHDSNSVITNRQASFETFPYRHRINTHELARSGFYYITRPRSIKCFYCTRTIPVMNHIPYFTHHSRLFHRSSGCPYAQQLNDRDPMTSTQQTFTTKCTWCLTNDKRLVALPCRHLSVCQSCGQTKRLCSVCGKSVTTYLSVHIP